MILIHLAGRITLRPGYQGIVVVKGYLATRSTTTPARQVQRHPRQGTVTVFGSVEDEDENYLEGVAVNNGRKWRFRQCEYRRGWIL